MTANCVFASAHSRGGGFHSAVARFKTKYNSFVAASSEGKCPLVLTARRSLEFSASMAFVVVDDSPQKRRKESAWGAKYAANRAELARNWEFVTLRKGVEGSLASSSIGRAIDSPQRLRQALAILPGGKIHGMANQMDDGDACCAVASELPWK